jgi:two-component sensor histidine kinase
VAFAVVFFGLKLAADWLFRWTIPEKSPPPGWAIVLTIGLGTLISSAVVYLLLRLLKRQREAVEELNHEVRNSLQVLSYVVPQCDETTRQEAQAAISAMSETVKRVSHKLGMEDHDERLTNGTSV